MTFLSRLVTCALAAAVVGCGGPDHEAYCEEQRDCIGGNDKDLEACIVSMDYMEDVADEQGCADEYEARFECREAETKCDSQDTGVFCQSNADCNAIGGGSCSDQTCKIKGLVLADPEACQPEERAFQQCAVINTGGI